MIDAAKNFQVLRGLLWCQVSLRLGQHLETYHKFPNLIMGGGAWSTASKIQAKRSLVTNKEMVVTYRRGSKERRIIDGVEVPVVWGFLIVAAEGRTVPSHRVGHGGVK